VSIIVKFFVAPDDTSASLALQPGPGRAFESLSFGNVDPEEAVLEWECLLAGVSFEELVEAGEPRIVTGQDNDGCVVFALSSRLSAALADARDRHPILLTHAPSRAPACTSIHSPTTRKAAPSWPSSPAPAPTVR
jgi:hypothetical protein